jgi:hypothetical protein
LAENWKYINGTGVHISQVGPETSTPLGRIITARQSNVMTLLWDMNESMGNGELRDVLYVSLGFNGRSRYLLTTPKNSAFGTVAFQSTPQARELHQDQRYACNSNPKSYRPHFTMKTEARNQLFGVWCVCRRKGTLRVPANSCVCSQRNARKRDQARFLTQWKG